MAFLLMIASGFLGLAWDGYLSGGSTTVGFGDRQLPAAVIDSAAIVAGLAVLALSIGFYLRPFFHATLGLAVLGMCLGCLATLLSWWRFLGPFYFGAILGTLSGVAAAVWHPARSSVPPSSRPADVRNP